jgi:hypothetical protein
MVFIRGAWIDLQPWHEDYHKYYCGGCHDGLWQHVDDAGNPYYICHFMNDRKIQNLYDDENYFIHNVVKPKWCPEL